MNTYYVKLHLKRGISHDDCINLFLDWINGSDKYDSEGLARSANEVAVNPYFFRKDNISLEIREYDDATGNITACRFVNKAGFETWTVSVVFFESVGENSYISVQQEYVGASADSLPRDAHRPFVVKKILDQGWIDAEWYFSLGEKRYGAAKDKAHYFTPDLKNANTVADILTGLRTEMLPVVYFSYNPVIHRFALSPNAIEKLAIDLMGTAYVIAEPKDTAVIDAISLKSDMKKVFRGHVGIYFPNNAEYVRINPEYHKNVADRIKRIVWEESLSRRTERDVTWKVLLNICEWKELIEDEGKELEKLKKKVDKKKRQLKFCKQMIEEKNIVAIPDAEDLEEVEATMEECRNLILQAIKNGKAIYNENNGRLRGAHLLDVLLSENSESRIFNAEDAPYKEDIRLNYENPDESFTQLSHDLDEKMKETRKELFSLEAQLSAYESEKICVIALPNEEHEKIIGEFNNLILECIDEELDKAESRRDSRAEMILRKVLNVNEEIGTSRAEMEEIAELVKKSDPWNESVEKSLSEKGFVFEAKNRHHKAYWYGDSRYPAIFSCTASDWHTAQNTASDIIKKISVYRK